MNEKCVSEAYGSLGIQAYKAREPDFPVQQGLGLIHAYRADLENQAQKAWKRNPLGPRTKNSSLKGLKA